MPPKLMANVRDGARTYGKSDPIDALAVARAALREPNLPEARLDGMEREVRPLVDHRDDLVAERTRIIGRLRWHLHELDPGWTPPKRLDRASAYDKIEAFLSELSGLVSDLAARLVDHLRRLTVEIKELATEITTRITVLAPSLLAIPGCAPLTAAKLIGETAGVDRFRSEDAFARHNEPHRCRCGLRTAHDIVFHVREIGGSMQQSISSHSPRLIATTMLVHSCPGVRPTATVAWKLCASSSADFPMSSIGPCSQTDH